MNKLILLTFFFSMFIGDAFAKHVSGQGQFGMVWCRWSYDVDEKGNITNFKKDCDFGGAGRAVKVLPAEAQQLEGNLRQKEKLAAQSDFGKSASKPKLPSAAD